MANQKSPIWWVVISRIIEFAACLDIILAWVLIRFFEFAAQTIFPPSKGLNKEARRCYLQALVSPHIYATITFLIVVFVKVHWHVLLAMMVFYCFCIGLIQPRGNLYYQLLQIEKESVTYSFNKKIMITKFIFATWAFLVVGIILILPSS